MTTRKIIIDCDPGIDDAVALTLALFDPRLEVVAITGTAGNVSADQANQNVQTLVDLLDPPRMARLGIATANENAPAIDARQIHGPDGLGNAGLVASRLARQHPSEKIICDEARAAPGEITLVCLGPLTNIARALKLEPNLPEMIHRVVIMGGSVAAGGNITPAAEFNMFCDPQSAREVFRSSLAKTLIPLDVTNQITWTLDLLSQLPAETSRAGHLLRKILPFLFRAYHQHLGREGIHLADVVAIAAAAHPELFTAVDMTVDVEVSGELTTGATIFDQRPNRRVRGDLEVAREVLVAGVTDYVLRGLTEAGKATS